MNPQTFARGMAAKLDEARRLVRTSGTNAAARKVQAARVVALARVLAPGLVPSPPADTAGLGAWLLAADAAIASAQPEAAAHAMEPPLAPGDVATTGRGAAKAKPAPAPKPAPTPIASPLPPPVRAAVTLADLLDTPPSHGPEAPPVATPRPTVTLADDVRRDLRDAVAAVQGLTGAAFPARLAIARSLAALAASLGLDVPDLHNVTFDAALTEWACDVAALLRPPRHATPTLTPVPTPTRGPIKLAPEDAARTLRLPETRVRIVSPHGGTYEYELRRPFDGGPIFVHVDMGAGKPAFLGSIFADGEYRHGRKSKLAPDAPEARAFAWVYHAARTGRGFGPVDVYDATGDTAHATGLH